MFKKNLSLSFSNSVVWCILSSASPVCISFHPLSGLAVRRGEEVGSRGQEALHPWFLHSGPLVGGSFLQASSRKLFGFNSQGTVDGPESEVVFRGGSGGAHPSKSSTSEGEEWLPFIIFLFFSVLSKVFFLTINFKFFLKDIRFVPTTVNEAKGKENSAGTRVSSVTHTALALSAESNWICLFSAPSMGVHRCTQGGVESHRRIFLSETKKMCCLSRATWR